MLFEGSLLYLLPTQCSITARIELQFIEEIHNNEAYAAPRLFNKYYLFKKIDYYAVALKVKKEEKFDVQRIKLPQKYAPHLRPRLRGFVVSYNNRILEEAANGGCVI